MSDTTFPRVTIGFYPRERFALAGKALSSIVKNTAIPYTLVIIDCATPERYRKEMEEAVAGLHDVRWVRTGEFVNPMRAANLAAEATDDPYVCLIENDCIVQPGWLESLIRTCETMPADAAIPLIYEGPTWRRKVHHDRGFAHLTWKEDPSGQRVIDVHADVKGLAGRYRLKEPQKITTVESHCTLYRRSALATMGRFDETLLVNSGTETSFRLFSKGLTMAFDPRAVVNHYPPTWVRRDERPYYFWRWDYARAEEGEKRFVARWKTTHTPDALDFAAGQAYRTSPFRWYPYSLLHAAKRHLADGFVRDSATFFVLSMTAAGLSYLFHPALARILSVEDYGEVQALLSMYGTFGLPIGIFSSIVVNIVANADIHDHHDAEKRIRLITALRHIASIVAIIVVATTILAAPFISAFFHFSSPAPVVAFAATFITVCAIVFRRAYLRGTKQFGPLGVSQILETGIRLVLAIALTLVGLRAVGAMMAVVLGQILIYFYVYAKTKDSLRYVPGVSPSLTPEVRGEIRYAGLILTSALITSIIAMADVLVVKHYFSPIDAGLYGGVSTIARIVMYVTGAVTSVLTASVRIKNPPAVNRLVLKKALILTTALGGSVLVTFVLAPSLVIKILIGRRYLADVSLLPEVSLLMFMVALTGPIFNYHLALRQRSATVIGAGAVALILTLCALNHANPVMVVADFIVGVSALLAAFIIKGIAAGRSLSHHGNA